MNRSWVGPSGLINVALVLFALTVVCLVSITKGLQGGSPGGGNYGYGYSQADEYHQNAWGNSADSYAQREDQRQQTQPETNPATAQDAPTNQYQYTLQRHEHEPERNAQFDGEVAQLDASSATPQATPQTAADLDDNANTVSPLPAGWVEYLDPSSGNPYYHHAEDGITTWTRPELPSVSQEPYIEKGTDGAGGTMTSAAPGHEASDAHSTPSDPAPSNAFVRDGGLNEQHAPLDVVAPDHFNLPRSEPHQDAGGIPQHPSVANYDHKQQQEPPRDHQVDASPPFWESQQPRTLPKPQEIRPWQADAPLANQPIDPNVPPSPPQPSAPEDPGQPQTTVTENTDQSWGSAMQDLLPPQTSDGRQTSPQAVGNSMPQSDHWQKQPTPSSPWGYRTSTGGPRRDVVGTNMPPPGQGTGWQQGSQPPQGERPDPWQYQNQPPPRDPTTPRPQQQPPLWSAAQQQRESSSMQPPRGAPQQGVYNQQPGRPYFPYGATGQGGQGGPPYGGQVVPGETPTGNVRGALGSAWQGVLGFGNRTMAAVGTASSTVASGAASAGQTISSTSSGLWGRARSTIEQVGRSMFESNENEKPSGGEGSYSLSNFGSTQGSAQGRGRMNDQGSSPQMQYGGYPGYNLPQPRSDAPYPHTGGDRQRPNPPMQSTWGGPQQQQQQAPPQWGQGYGHPTPSTQQQQQQLQQTRGTPGGSWQHDPPPGNQQQRQEQRPFPQAPRPMNPPQNPGWGSGQGR